MTTGMNCVASGGGNAQYEKTSQAMSNSYTAVNLDCTADELISIYIHVSGYNHSSVMFNNGDGTYFTLNQSNNVDIRVNNGQVEFWYNWTGSGVEYDIDYCYSM